MTVLKSGWVYLTGKELAEKFRPGEYPGLLEATLDGGPSRWGRSFYSGEDGPNRYSIVRPQDYTIRYRYRYRCPGPKVDHDGPPILRQEVGLMGPGYVSDGGIPPRRVLTVPMDDPTGDDVMAWSDDEADGLIAQGRGRRYHG